MKLHWTCKILQTYIDTFGAAKIARVLGIKARTLRRYTRGGNSYKYGVPASTFMRVMSIRLSQVA